MKVRELLSDKSKWSKHHYAQDASGKPTSPHSENAVAWCLVGAIEKCYGMSHSTKSYGAAARALRCAAGELFGAHGLVPWQDRTDVTFGHIQQVLQKADV